MEKVPEIVGALQSLLGFFDTVGIPGFLALFFLGPTMIVVALFALERMRHREEAKKEEIRRQEREAYLEFLREKQEAHRLETERVLRDLTAKHGEVVQFYKDNVELVKTTQRLAIDLRDLIVNNTRALEHLTSVSQANFFCPVAREKATGKQ